MSDKVRRFFSADSLERAVLDAASHFGIAPEELGYEPVEKRGLTKRRKVVIRVDPERPRRPAGEKREIKEIHPKGTLESAPRSAIVGPAHPPSAVAVPQSRSVERSAADRAEPPAPRESVTRPSAPAPAPSPAPRPAPDPVTGARAMEIRLPASPAEWFDLLPEADVAERVAAERWTTALLDLAGLELTPRVRQGEEQLELSLSGTDAEWLADDDGEILLSIQHLLPRLMQSDLERLVSCRVDCGGFQLLREERLRARAHWAAEEVRSECRVVTLEPMPPADRRIIHLALVHDSSVDTESLGRGYFKRVSVRPA